METKSTLWLSARWITLMGDCTELYLHPFHYVKKSHAQQACFHPVIGQLLFVGGFSSHQLSPIHIYQELGAKRKVEISSIFHLSGILFVLSYSSRLFPSSASCLACFASFIIFIFAPDFFVLDFALPTKQHRNKKLRICSLPIRLPHKPPPSTNPWAEHECTRFSTKHLNSHLIPIRAHVYS